MRCYNTNKQNSYSYVSPYQQFILTKIKTQSFIRQLHYIKYKILPIKINFLNITTLI